MNNLLSRIKVFLLMLGLALSQAPVHAAAASPDKSTFKDKLGAESKSVFTMMVLATSAGLPRTAGKKPTPTLAGETITLTIGSAVFSGSADPKKGKMTTPFKASLVGKSGKLSLNYKGAALISLLGLSTTDGKGKTVSVILKITADKTGQTQVVLFHKFVTYTYNVKKGKISGKLKSEVEFDAPSITFDPVGTKILGDADFLVHATSNSTGAITYSIQSGPGTMADATHVHITGAGTIVVLASEVADANFNAGTQALSVTVNKPATTTVAAAASVNQSTAAQTIFLSVTVTSLAGTVNEGTVTFQLKSTGGAPVGTAVTSSTVSGGVASVSTYSLPGGTAAGSYSIDATYNPGTDLAGSADTGNTKLTVNTAVADLGMAAPYGTFGGGSGMTNQGIFTVVNGDIGTTGASTTITGFHDSTGDIYTETPLNKGQVNGRIYTAPPTPGGAGVGGNASTLAIATQAASDANAAYNNLSPASLPGGMDPGAGQLGGSTLPPGIYKSAGATFQITGSDLTLDAQGDANAAWVFQMAASLTVGAPAAPRSVILINGAQAKNVFWWVGSAATINAAGGGTMVGTIMASSGVTFSTAGNVTLVTLNGRALALHASTTLVNTIINVPGP